MQSDEVPTKPRPRSIAKRLFFSAALLSSAILLVAGLVLSTIYRRTAEANFDERLSVYLHALVADIATPKDDSRTAPGQLGEPQFELAFSGWYWQITRLDLDKPEIRNSRSLFAAKLPRLSDAGVPAGIGGARRGYVKGPDDRVLRMLERIIDTSDQGIYLVQVAARTDEIDAQISRFELDLIITFSALAVALVASSAAQLRYGLKPLWQLQEGVAAIRRGEAEKIEGDFFAVRTDVDVQPRAFRDIDRRLGARAGWVVDVPLLVFLLLRVAFGRNGWRRLGGQRGSNECDGSEPNDDVRFQFHSLLKLSALSSQLSGCGWA